MEPLQLRRNAKAEIKGKVNPCRHGNAMNATLTYRTRRTYSLQSLQTVTRFQPAMKIKQRTNLKSCSGEQLLPVRCSR